MASSPIFNIRSANWFYEVTWQNKEDTWVCLDLHQMIWDIYITCWALLDLHWCGGELAIGFWGSMSNFLSEWASSLRSGIELTQSIKDDAPPSSPVEQIWARLCSEMGNCIIELWDALVLSGSACEALIINGTLKWGWIVGAGKAAVHLFLPQVNSSAGWKESMRRSCGHLCWGFVHFLSIMSFCTQNNYLSCLFPPLLLQNRFPKNHVVLERAYFFLYKLHSAKLVLLDIKLLEVEHFDHFCSTGQG